MKKITPEQLKERLEHNNNGRSYIVVDVREQAERDAAMVPGTLNIPLREVEERIDEISGYDDVYIHCRSGGRSQKACEKLTDLGLDNVVNVEGGILGMQSAGFAYRVGKKKLKIKETV